MDGKTLLERLGRVEAEDLISEVKEIDRLEIRRIRLDLTKENYVQPLLEIGLEKKELSLILSRLATGEAVCTDDIYNEEARYGFNSLLLSLGLRYKSHNSLNGDSGFMASSLFQREALSDLAQQLLCTTVTNTLPKREANIQQADTYSDTDDDLGPMPPAQKDEQFTLQHKSKQDPSWTKTPRTQPDREQWMLQPPSNLDFIRRVTIPEAKSRFSSKHQRDDDAPSDHKALTSSSNERWKVEEDHKKKKENGPSLLDLHLKKRKQHYDVPALKRGWNRDRDINTRKKLDAAGLTILYKKQKKN